MNMILHEAIPMHLHIFFSGNLREAFQILAFVEAVPKEFGAIYTARNNMMGDAFQNDPSCSGHRVNLAIQSSMALLY